MPDGPLAEHRQCPLLIFLATPSEETGMIEAAKARNISCVKIGRRQSHLGEDYYRLGNEPGVVAIGPARNDGRGLVMGASGWFGTAARGMRLRIAFGSQGIVQLGMAFGIDPARQKVGDVLVSTALVPYDNRIVEAVPGNAGVYRCDYSGAKREPARASLVEIFRREQKRGGHPFAVSLGAILSGAAVIRSSVFRDELLNNVPSGEDPIIGGEMEGVGLIAASVASDDPVWCIVKGIYDFADGATGPDFRTDRAIACRNSADFVLSALANDLQL